MSKTDSRTTHRNISLAIKRHAEDRNAERDRKNWYGPKSVWMRAIIKNLNRKLRYSAVKDINSQL
jgi:hypothetical protein